MSVVAALAIWLRTPTPLLREHLKVLQFWSLELCFVLLLASVGLVLREVFRTLHVRDVFSVAGLAALATALTLFVAPRTNRIYFDEQIYQGIGQNLSDMKLAQMCNDGTVEYGRLQCWTGEYNKQPYAYPHLLSVAYRVFGVSEGVAFGVNAAVMALTVCGVYLLVLVAFGDRPAAFFAGLIMALVPQHIAVVGHGGGGAVRGAGMRAGAPLRRPVQSVEELGRAGRHWSRGCLRRPVPTRIPADHCP